MNYYHQKQVLLFRLNSIDFYTHFKVTTDIILPFLLIVALLPLILVITLIVYISDGFPIVFKQSRIGKNGKSFDFYKFRTLKTSVNPYGESPQSFNDSNIIKGGNILRAYSLDELPQLFNVLKGQMSMVGPRPLFKEHIKNLSKFHKQRLIVKPGLTGMSQINMRSDLLSKKSLDMEVEYVNSNSILLDMKIMLQTIQVIINRKGVFNSTGD